ncbi:MAG: hypothetical protein LAO79_11860 [Acidobacteriia bacterium]|nr:hypothetical protein [Terriglobia bacterium]
MFRSICAALTCVVAFANWNDTATGINFDALPHLRLTKLRSGFLKDGERATFDRITATAASGNQRGVVLRGIGKSGRHWEIHTFNLDEVYRGDLDANGTPDYVFFGGGPYFNGRMTPLFSLSILMMDRDGMPVPFFTVVYTGENGDGIKHILDLNRDGHAQVLISMYDEIPSDPKAQFCSGHWTNQVYQFTNLAAQEVRGTIGGIQFPLVHNWSYGAAECGESSQDLNLDRAPEIADHGTGSRDSLARRFEVSTARSIFCRSIRYLVVNSSRRLCSFTIGRAFAKSHFRVCGVATGAISPIASAPMEQPSNSAGSIELRATIAEQT